MNRGELMSKPMAGILAWHVEPETDAVVAECRRCGAEMRVLTQPGVANVTFLHEADCSWLRGLEEKMGQDAGA